MLLKINPDNPQERLISQVVGILEKEASSPIPLIHFTVSDAIS